MTKYLALLFLVIAALVFFLWALPSHFADGSGWVSGGLALLAVIIIRISRRNTGKTFTNDSGGH